MIKLFLCDVDGVLTDGFYHTTEEGKISKTFFTRDFHGLWMLDQSGVKIGIITAANDNTIVHQCSRGAKYATVHRGVKDKYQIVLDNYIDDGFSWDEIAFIGDDVFDMELMAAVGVCACPSDADSVVLELIENINEGINDGFRSSFPGGKGSVREFAEYVLKINDVLKINEIMK